ncbi:MAG TPA: hypothetical protein VGE07_10795, partial [Herpetosiphonaceae bacterium]
MRRSERGGRGTFGRAIAEHGLLFAGLVAVVAPIALLLPGLPALVIGAIIWLGACAASTARLPTVGGWGMLCLAIPMAGMGLYFPGVVALETGTIVRGQPVAAAPANPRAAGFEFSAAVVQTDFAATVRSTSRSSSGGSASGAYHIAPLTGPEWRPGDPVPAWAGCSDSLGPPCPGWREGLRAALPAAPLLASNLAKARDRALASHGLREQPGAPLLELTASV